MKTINIKGKEYVEVNERIKFFRKNYPGCGIRIEWLQLELDGNCCCKATITDEADRIISEGTAFERSGSTFINKTSHVENCETSAVGRALGNLGIGIDTSVASAEEVQNAIENQKLSFFDNDGYVIFKCADKGKHVTALDMDLLLKLNGSNKYDNLTVKLTDEEIRRRDAE